VTAPLRLVTYLVPSVPKPFYDKVADHLSRRLGRPASLAVDRSRSGPHGGGPLGRGEADVAFLCGSAVGAAGTDLTVLAAAVPAGARGGGEPVYWSDVVVAAGSDAGAFEDLRGRAFAYNDPGSLSGVWSVAARLLESGAGWEFFGRVERSGSHLESVGRVAAGGVDAAAIDSIVLERLAVDEPALAGRVRTLVALGPYLAPPVVARGDLEPPLREAVRAALLEPALADAVRDDGFAGFAPVSPAAYRWQAARLRAAAGLPPPGA